MQTVSTPKTATAQPLTIDDDPMNGKHYMAITDHTGDTKVMWSKDNPDEVDNAKATFDRMKGKGYSAFRVEGKKGEQGQQMNTFDPEAERIIFVKQMIGG